MCACEAYKKSKSFAKAKLKKGDYMFGRNGNFLCVGNNQHYS